MYTVFYVAAACFGIIFPPSSWSWHQIFLKPTTVKYVSL